MTERMYMIHVDQSLCKGCHICIGFCPRQALGRADRINPRGFVQPMAENPDRCTGCRLCEIMCPDFAIAVEEALEEIREGAR